MNLLENTNQKFQTVEYSFYAHYEPFNCICIIHYLFLEIEVDGGKWWEI